MPVKSFHLDEVGIVKIYKRHKVRRLNLRISGDTVRVTQPFWLPYTSGLEFAKNNLPWITDQKKHQASLTVKHQQNIGKCHQVEYIASDRLKSRIAKGKILIGIPNNLTMNSPEVKQLAKTAIKRALKKEAAQYLVKRLDFLAKTYDFKVNNIYLKSLRTRWGSCNSRLDITLNTYLMMLPDDLIDYVLLHELTHTKILNHSKIFWVTLGSILPDYHERRKALKAIQQQILSI